jgi:hypothetical protein
MEAVNAIVQSQGKLLRLSGSIRSGSGIDHLYIVATYVNRHERKEVILIINFYSFSGCGILELWS